MNREKFKKYIESIGFNYFYGYYKYKECEIYFYPYYYDFYNEQEWSCNIEYNDLTLVEKYLKKELRSIKLKQLLG